MVINSRLAILIAHLISRYQIIISIICNYYYTHNYCRDLRREERIGASVRRMRVAGLSRFKVRR